MKKKVTSIGILVVLITIVFCINIFLYNSKNEVVAQHSLTPDELVSLYLNALESKNEVAIYPLFYYGKESYGKGLNDIDDAFLQNNNDKTVLREVLAADYNYLFNTFGSDVFKSITYDLIERKGSYKPNGNEYLEKDTGRHVSSETAIKLNKEYWSKIAKDNNLSEADIFSFTYGKIDTDNQKRGFDLYQKYVSNEPCILGSNSSIWYYVKLYFNNNDTAVNGDNQYHIMIQNYKGYWGITDGLMWTTYYEPEDRPDI